MTVNVRYMVDDVDAAVAFYTGHLGFTLLSSAAPAFADVVRGNLRLLLSGQTSSAGRPMPDGRQPQPGGWNRIHLIVADLAAEVERLRGPGRGGPPPRAGTAPQVGTSRARRRGPRSARAGAGTGSPRSRPRSRRRRRPASAQAVQGSGRSRRGRRSPGLRGGRRGRP